ncbi:MAG: glycosyltransferase family 39 protein [Proteobacteria bacterium]|nr:glycosyltransferase family 39 protein [Pseudomonadota bacterium]HQR03273.1 glycosyltransferase family 39 protein [Rhodocyclaceae bacterium]
MKRSVWIVWIALAAIWFGTLGDRALVRPDEGRYAEIPREMVARGDWLTPRLNDIKYFEKPALQYWATAAGYEIFGQSEWTARLWPAITGFLGILLAGWTGYRLWGPREGMLAAGILASSLLYLVMGHVITLDMGLAFFLQLAWTGFIFAQQENHQTSRRWMWMAWAALALAVLSKGLVALVLTGATLTGYSLLNRDLSPWRRLAPLSGMLIFLAIAAPWFIAVSLANPEFPHFFFIHEHFERFLTSVHRRNQPDWYFIFIYALGALPWTLLLLHALVKSWGRRIAGAFNPERFLLVWIIVTFAFFSVSSSKLPPYILPIFPALALLGARHLPALSRRAWLVHLALLALVALPALILAPGLTRLVDKDYSLPMLQGLAAWLTLAAALSLAGIILAAFAVRKGRNVSAVVLLALSGFLCSTAILQGHDHLNPFNSARALAAQVKDRLQPGLPFYSVLYYEQTLPFYIQRTLTLVEYRDEMDFGLRQEPNKWIPTVAEFEARWRQDPAAYAIMTIGVFENFIRAGLPMREIGRDRRYVIAEKPAAASPAALPAAPKPAPPQPAAP